MVFIPNDKLLAEYRKDFANTLALFEQRADGNMRPSENFGFTRETVNSQKMLKEIHEDNANVVDDYTFLKSRLFDMSINDWDRHEGQWRRGEIDCDSTNADNCEKLKAEKKYWELSTNPWPPVPTARCHQKDKLPKDPAALT